MEEVKRMERQKSYICIDLKSFYASVECVERDLDPFTTNLVVADPTRSQSTICLAITPAMKKLGVKNRYFGIIHDFLHIWFCWFLKWTKNLIYFEPVKKSL